MINPISMAQPMNNNLKRNNQNFGMAYRIDSQWYDTFNTSKELNFISKIKEKANSGLMRYISSDGLTYRFKCPEGDILFMKEQKGLMSNVKFIPNRPNSEGFYIINNGSAVTESMYKDMTKALNNVLKRDYQKTRTVIKVLKHNPLYNAQAKARLRSNVGYVYA